PDRSFELAGYPHIPLAIQDQCTNALSGIVAGPARPYAGAVAAVDPCDEGVLADPRREVGRGPTQRQLTEEATTEDQVATGRDRDAMSRLLARRRIGPGGDGRTCRVEPRDVDAGRM